MNQELKDLIEMALADGVLTEKERAILLRKAVALGEDKDEVELILDGRISLMQKNQRADQPTTIASAKEGSRRKCPSCGSTAGAFATKCPDCGHEFRDTRAAHSMQELNTQLQEVADRIRSEKAALKTNWTNVHLVHPVNIAKEIAVAQASIIVTFPIPNTREDILEFLSIALSQATAKVVRSKILGDTAAQELKYAWCAKCEQIIMKARLSMHDDKKTLDEIEAYEKQLRNN